MQIHKFPLGDTGFFSGLFLDYISGKKELESFYDLYPEPQNIIRKSETVRFEPGKRSVLHEALQEQYKSVSVSGAVKENLNLLLQDNCYTVTTGHQLNLFTGPLYFIFKIITVIQACRRLNEMQDGRKFVPVYWMASEDHDFEEINHFYLFNKKYQWETSQQGPVGKFTTAGIEKIFPEIKDKLPLFEKAYTTHSTLSDATRYLVNALFGDYGLLIIDGDHPALKKECVDMFKEEVLHEISHKYVADTTQRLKELGYEGQVHSREINLFYMEAGRRERIIHEGEAFAVNNTDIKFTKEEITRLIEAHPEKISPNVILRPLYQQEILPNVCYIGGPAEVAYWLQLKGLFDRYKANFPVLMPRNFALLVNKNIASKMHKLKLEPASLFLNEQKLKEKYLSEMSGDGYLLASEEEALDALFEKIKDKAKTIDPTLEAYVLAEKQKIKKSLEQVEKKLKKAEEQKHETILSQLLNIKAKLFPEGVLQERRDNVLNFYISDPGIIDKWSALLDPYDFRFNILVEDE